MSLVIARAKLTANPGELLDLGKAMRFILLVVVMDFLPSLGESVEKLGTKQKKSMI